MLTEVQIEAMRSEDIATYIALEVMGWFSEQGVWNEGQKGHSRSFCRWDPANDLNDAIEAAGKVGFLIPKKPGSRENAYFDLRWIAPNSWCAGWFRSNGFPLFVGKNASTPAISVCRAVIAANEAKK